MENQEQEQKREICPLCKLPIHIDDWGGIKNFNGKPGFFHKECILTLESNEEFIMRKDK